MFKLDKEKKREIVNYCLKLSSTLKTEYLTENLICKNEFLEFIYLTCLEAYEKSGDYTLTQEEITILFTVKKENEHILSKIRSKELNLVGINKNDVLIVEVEIKKEEENEIID